MVSTALAGGRRAAVFCKGLGPLFAARLSVDEIARDGGSNDREGCEYQIRDEVVAGRLETLDRQLRELGHGLEAVPLTFAAVPHGEGHVGSLTLLEGGVRVSLRLHVSREDHQPLAVLPND